jgi:hypothetical protein
LAPLEPDPEEELPPLELEPEEAEDPEPEDPEPEDPEPEDPEPEDPEPEDPELGLDDESDDLAAGSDLVSDFVAESELAGFSLVSVLVAPPGRLSRLSLR